MPVNGLGHFASTLMDRPPLPPFSLETATQKVRLADHATLSELGL